MSEDFALPWVDIVSPEAVTYPRSARVVVRWHATGDGILTETASLDGEPVCQGQAIDMLWLQPGAHTLRVWVTDETGRAERSVTFSVAVSLEGLLEATGRLVTEGAIAAPLPGRRLEACLRAARAHARSGRRTQLNGRLQVFLDELDAHVGRDLSPQAHTLLRRDALTLLDFQG
jgi:hypothetical protein